MSDAEKPTLDEINAIIARLRELLLEAAKQAEALRPLAALCDKVGVENVDWFVLVEMVARTEMLRRLHAEIERGRVLIGAEPAASAALN